MRRVLLQGGLRNGDEIERRALLRPLTGLVEEECHDAVRAEPETAAAVSAVLAAAIERLGDADFDTDTADSLCIADRRQLMLAVAGSLAGDRCWVSANCTDCGERYDVPVDRSQLPRKPAGAGFPHAEVELNGDTVTLRVPTGADQRAIRGRSHKEARDTLVRRCVVEVNGATPQDSFFDRLTSRDIETFEKALDSVAPDIGVTLAVNCPACSAQQEAEVDPYQFDVVAGSSALTEVHTLASHYHWSERDILGLTRERRRQYLGFIERSQGKVS